MENKFKTLAQEVTNVAEITKNRERITTEEIIKNFPDGITITECDLFTGDKGVFAVCAFAEADNVYFYGGKTLTEIVKKWINGENPVEVSKALTECGGVKIKMSETKTKSGNNYTKVEII